MKGSCATTALEQAGVAYAVAGGNAVAVWVTRVDESAVRNTRDVDILIRARNFRPPGPRGAGFVYTHTAGLDLFLDGPSAKPRDAVHIVFAGEKVRPEEALPNPDVTESVPAEHFRVLDFEALVGSSSPAFRDKDKTHLRDLIEVGLIDVTGARGIRPICCPSPTLIDTPGG